MEHEWLSLPSLPGYEIRDDFSKVRSITRQVWVAREGFELTREEVRELWLKGDEYLKKYAFFKIFKGKLLKLRPFTRHGKRTMGYRIYGNFFAKQRLIDDAIGRKHFTIPSRCPLLVLPAMNLWHQWGAE